MTLNLSCLLLLICYHVITDQIVIYHCRENKIFAYTGGIVVDRDGCAHVGCSLEAVETCAAATGILYGATTSLVPTVFN